MSNGGSGGRSQLVEGARVVGDVTAPGTFEVHGRIEGRVEADGVVVEAAGAIEGEVRAEQITVRGTFRGHLDGAVVRLQAGARVDGTLRYGTLTIESGAEITATCERRPSVAPKG